jgi:hypothetical protein
MTKIKPKKSIFDCNKKTYKQTQIKYFKKKFRKDPKKDPKNGLKLFSMPKDHF